MGATWVEVEDRLEAALVALEDREFLVLGEPAADPGPRRGLLRRRPAPPPRRYTQFRFAGDWIYAECVGSELFGGDWAATPQQHESLRELGWLAPGDEDPTQTQPPYPNYWRTVPSSERARLSSPAVRALEVLDADPGELVLERGRV